MCERRTSENERDSARHEVCVTLSAERLAEGMQWRKPLSVVTDSWESEQLLQDLRAWAHKRGAKFETVASLSDPMEASRLLFIHAAPEQQVAGATCIFLARHGVEESNPLYEGLVTELVRLRAAGLRLVVWTPKRVTASVARMFDMVLYEYTATQLKHARTFLRNMVRDLGDEGRFLLPTEIARVLEAAHHVRCYTPSHSGLFIEVEVVPRRVRLERSRTA